MEQPEKYLNPFTDFGFKKLFGSEPNKDLLIDFLNQVLPDKHLIKDLTYSRTEQLGQTEVDRRAVFDLYCIGENGERFIVEMQKAKQTYFKDRSVYYSSFLIQEQGQKGSWDFYLSPIYTVAVLDFKLPDDDDCQEVRHEVQLKDLYGKVFYEKLTFIYLEMPNFVKNETELVSNFDKWMFVLKNLSALKDRPSALQDRIFQRLFDSAEIAKFTPEEAIKYQESLKNYRDWKNTIDTSFDEGIEKGVEIGKEIGKNEAMINFARQLKAYGDPIDKIIQLTGLSAEEIEIL